MRTLEFGAYPTAEQRQRLEAWLLLHRRIWNYGIALLLELSDFSAYDKASKTRVPCCPVPWSYRWQKADDGGWQAIPYSQIRRHRDGWGTAVRCLRITGRRVSRVTVSWPSLRSSRRRITRTGPN